MTWSKIATVALGIAALVGGALLPTVREYLLPAGMLLLGLASPEVGKKEPPSLPTEGLARSGRGVGP